MTEITNIEESSLKNLSPRELHQKLKYHGWKPEGGTNHELYSHPDHNHKVAVPRHKGFIRTGTLKQILKDANIKETLYNKIRYIVKESDEKKKQKLILGKNKSKVIINPPIKEMLDQKVLTTKELIRAVYFPEGILGDPDASSQLKDYAFSILQLRLGNT
jgi:predicted RNA binding protein YcfA (HicA-like mRNA interferase family)